MPSDLIGRYRLLQPIAQGGMAEIYLARQEGPGGFEKTVVIKRMRPHLARDPEFMTMFMNEARVVARLSHPNIVQVYDFGELDGSYFLCMEWLVGGDLEDICSRLRKRSQFVPPPVAAVILSAVCDALHYAHNLKDASGNLVGLVHRDLSPQNIFVTTQGWVKVLDFGIVKMAGRGHETRAGVIKGKPYYLSPEQIRGKTLDGRSDLFALGAVLYELVTGVRPFQRDEELACMNAILEDEIPSPRTHVPTLPEQLERIIMKSLERDLTKRYQTARDMRVALDGYVAACTSSPSARQLQGFMEDLWAEPNPAAAPPPAAAPQPIQLVAAVAPPASAPIPAPAVAPAQAPAPDPEEMLATNAAMPAPPPKGSQTSVSEPEMTPQPGPSPVEVAPDIDEPTAREMAPTDLGLSTNEMIRATRRKFPVLPVLGIGVVALGAVAAFVWMSRTPEVPPKPAPIAVAPPPPAPVATPTPPPPAVDPPAAVSPPPSNPAVEPAKVAVAEPPPAAHEPETKTPLRSEPAPLVAKEAKEAKEPHPARTHRVASAAPPKTHAGSATSATPPPPPSGVEYGTLDVNCIPWCQVWIDGASSARNSPILNLQLAVGAHHVKVVQPESGAQQTREVAIEANQKAKAIIRF